jgi:N-acetylmuramoyl-L-alanine amidase
MKKWENIIVHHSASEWGSALVIDKWHKERGWNGIGYHFVITNGYPNYLSWKNDNLIIPLKAQVEVGRYLDYKDNWCGHGEIGAHALGFNRNSIGICLIHLNAQYQCRQLKIALNLIDYLRLKFKIDIKNIYGHYELDSKKPLCPGIDMDLMRKYLRNEITFEKLLNSTIVKK